MTSLGRFQPRTFAVKLAQPSVKLAAASIDIRFTLPYDLAVANRDGERLKHGFDGEGFALPAEMLPRELSYAGIVFRLAPANGANAMVARGQRFHCRAACDGYTCLRRRLPAIRTLRFVLAMNGERDDSELEWFHRAVGRSAMEAD